MGPGDASWEKFGHIAVRIEDPEARYPDVVYNWGVFDFQQKNFYFNFIQGRMIYSVGAYDGPGTLDMYRELKRTVWEQVLHLSGAQKILFERMCVTGSMRANRNYRYDYYLDNCSTRVRDLIDRAVDGQLKKLTESQPSGTTFRWHTRRLTTDDIPLYVALQTLMGHPIDRPISRWEEMFLPEKLREILRGVTVLDPQGKRVPLVESEQVLVQGSEAPVRITPPNRVPLMLLFSLLVGGGLAALGVAGAKRRGARVAFLLIATAWLLLLGIGGTIIVWAWCFTDHAVARYNENILQVNPVSLLLLFLIWRGTRREPANHLASKTAFIVAGLSVAGLALKIAPFFFQVNGDIIALCLPAQLCLAWVLWRMAARNPRPTQVMEPVGS